MEQYREGDVNITYVDEALYADKLSIVFDNLSAARETQDRVREFIRSHPTVYCGTYTPQSFELWGFSIKKYV